MAKLSDIVAFLDEELRTAEIPDYPGAHNGLQLENRSGEVTKVATAVDATLPVIRKAVDDGADLLVVHHGMFWQGVQMLRGAQFEKLRLAMDSGLAIYSSHIPLDVHPTYGNNACLAREISADADWQPYFEWKGIQLGLSCYLDMPRSELAARVESATGHPLLGSFGDQIAPAGQVGIITGGAGSEIGAMIDQKINTFVTGEGPHWSHGVVEESDSGLILGGHYATETFGVRSIGEVLVRSFSLESSFIKNPSGL